MQIFNSDQFGQLRILEGKDEEMWFIARDVSETLGYTKLTEMYKHVDKEDKQEINPHSAESVANAGCLVNGTTQIETNENIKRLVIINESGLYNAIFGSTLPQAKVFKKWVTKEVLPSIRKSGSYSVANSKENLLLQLFEKDPLVVANAHKQLVDIETKPLIEKIEEQEPKVDYYEQVLQSPTTVSITQIAKDYGMSASSLNHFLSEQGIQFRTRGQWVLYSQYAKLGYTGSDTHLKEGRHGDSVIRTKWTQKGREFIHSLLVKHNKI